MLNLRGLHGPLIVAALGLGVAAPVAASAATVSFAKPCYDDVPGNLMTITGTGFTPGDSINLDTNANIALPSVTAGLTGEFALQSAVPSITPPGPGEKTFELTATSQTDAAVSAESPFMVANFAVATSPAQARPTRVVKFSFSGFPDGAAIYSHFVRRGKVLATKRYGTAAAPCGTLTTRAKLFPGLHPEYGRYTVQFDSSHHYSSRSTPRLVGILDVFRSFKFR